MSNEQDVRISAMCHLKLRSHIVEILKFVQPVNILYVYCICHFSSFFLCVCNNRYGTQSHMERFSAILHYFNILKSHCPHSLGLHTHLSEALTLLWEQLLFVAKGCQCAFWGSQLCHAYSLHEDT